MLAQRLLQPRHGISIARLFMQDPCHVVAGGGPTDGKGQMGQGVLDPPGTHHGNPHLIAGILIGWSKVADDFTGFQTFLPVLFRSMQPHQLQLHLDILRMHCRSILQNRQCLLTTTSRLFNASNAKLWLNTVRVGNRKLAIRLHRLCVLLRILLIQRPCQQIFFCVPAEHPLSFPELWTQFCRCGFPEGQETRTAGCTATHQGTAAERATGQQQHRIQHQTIWL